MKKLIYFAFGLMLATSCGDDYDDAELKSGLGDLNNRMGEYEARLEQLQSSVSNLKNKIEVFETLRDEDGVVAGIVRFDDDGTGRSGLEITVNTLGGNVKKYSVYDGADVENGNDGENGEAGKSPELGVAADEDGRLYWTVDGEPLLNGEDKVYATGEKGEKGDDGVNGNNGITPQFKVGKDPDNQDDPKDYWLISLDEGRNWKKLGDPITEKVVVGVGGLNIEYDSAAQIVTFTLDGKSYSFAVQPPFTLSGKEQNTIREGQTRTYGYELEGELASGYLVKVFLQNANDDFSVQVDPDKKVISVTANKPGKRNTVVVELVKQNGQCWHYYFEVVSEEDGPRAASVGFGGERTVGALINRAVRVPVVADGVDGDITVSINVKGGTAEGATLSIDGHDYAGESVAVTLEGGQSKEIDVMLKSITKQNVPVELEIVSLAGDGVTDADIDAETSSVALSVLKGLQDAWNGEYDWVMRYQDNKNLTFPAANPAYAGADTTANNGKVINVNVDLEGDSIVLSVNWFVYAEVMYEGDVNMDFNGSDGTFTWRLGEKVGEANDSGLGKVKCAYYVRSTGQDGDFGLTPPVVVTPDYETGNLLWNTSNPTGDKNTLTPTNADLRMGICRYTEEEPPADRGNGNANSRYRAMCLKKKKQ